MKLKGGEEAIVLQHGLDIDARRERGFFFFHIPIRLGSELSRRARSQWSCSSFSWR
jgi:hypothetical protein